MELPPKDVRFTHTPLNFRNKEIRLITIEPTTDPSSPIHITMEHVDFSERINASTRYRKEKARLEPHHRLEPISREQDSALYDKFLEGTFNFVALSYTWGPELPAQDIFVTSPECQGWFSVRQNLYEFLKTKRDWLSVRQNVDEFLEIGQHLDPASFWIDQLCINQGENDEKAHQVNQMADIYSAASVVEAWLGSGFEGSNELVDLIIHESSLDHQSIHEGRPTDQSLSELFVVTEQEMRALFPLLRQFARLAYWSRLWVTQEIVLGRVVHLRIGSKTVSWDILYKGWLGLRETMLLWETWNRKAWDDLFETEEYKDMARHGNMVWKRIRDIGRGRYITVKSWDNVQDLIRGTECSNVRDRVFGMMGMIHPSLRVFPDYSMHPQDILLELLNKQITVIAQSQPPSMDQLEKKHEKVQDIREDCVWVAAFWLSQLEDNEHRINRRIVRRHILSIVPLDLQDYSYEEWRIQFDRDVLDHLPEKLRKLPLVVPWNLLRLYYPVGKTWHVKYSIWKNIPNERSILWRLVRAGRHRVH